MNITCARCRYFYPSAGDTLCWSCKTPSPTKLMKRDAKGELVWGTCDGCGDDIAPEFLEAATQVPPDYMPEDFRNRATTVLCELCRTEGDA